MERIKEISSRIEELQKITTTNNEKMIEIGDLFAKMVSEDLAKTEEGKALENRLETLKQENDKIMDEMRVLENERRDIIIQLSKELDEQANAVELQNALDLVKASEVVDADEKKMEDDIATDKAIALALEEDASAGASGSGASGAGESGAGAGAGAVVDSVKSDDELINFESDIKMAELASTTMLAGVEGVHMGENHDPDLYNALNRKFSVVNVRGDGKCFYYSLALALKLNHPEFVTPTSKTTKAKDLVMDHYEEGNLPFCSGIKNILEEQANINEEAKKPMKDLEGGSILGNIKGESTQAQQEVIAWISKVFQINIIIMHQSDKTKFTYYLVLGSDVNVYLFHTGGHYMTLIKNSELESVRKYNPISLDKAHGEGVSYKEKYLKYKRKYLALRKKLAESK